jgi:hypothetical protein
MQGLEEIYQDKKMKLERYKTAYYYLQSRLMAVDFGDKNMIVTEAFNKANDLAKGNINE